MRSAFDVELKFDAHQKMIWLGHIGTSLIGALQRRRFSSRSKNLHQPTLYLLHQTRRNPYRNLVDFGIILKMSKRHNTSSVDNRAKRQQVDDFRNDTEFVNSVETTSQALALLAEQADELVVCLQSLKRQFSQSTTPTDFQIGTINPNLSRLTRRLLPSFQIIGSIDEPAAETARPLTKETSTVCTVSSVSNSIQLIFGKGYRLRNCSRLIKHTSAVSCQRDTVDLLRYIARMASFTPNS